MGNAGVDEKVKAKGKIKTEQYILSQRSFYIVLFLLLVAIGIALIIFANTDAGHEVILKMQGFHDLLRERGWLK